jgi:hypothetical protein
MNIQMRVNRFKAERRIRRFIEHNDPAEVKIWLREVLRQAILEHPEFEEAGTARLIINNAWERAERHQRSPYFGRLLISLLVSVEKQQDRLADFEEMLAKIWIPQFGPLGGRLVYIWNALKSAGAIIRISVTAAIADWIARKLGL